MTSKIVKIGLYVLLFIFLLMGTAILAIRTPWVQNIIVSKITKNLSEKLGTEVSIESVDVAFPNYAVVNGLRILDFDNDTLAHIDKIKLAFEDYDKVENLIDINSLILEKPDIYFHKKKGGDGFNYNQLISKLSSGNSSGSGGAFKMRFGELIIQNGDFIFHNENLEEPKGRAFKENNIRVHNINLHAKDFDIVNDSLHMDLVNLDAVEESGLRVNQLKSILTISGSGIYFDDLLLKTNESIILDQFSMATSNYLSYAHFIDSVYMRGKLASSTIKMNDLIYFSDELKQFKGQELDVSGEFKGTLRKIKLKKGLINYGDHTHIEVDAKLRGLPFWDETFMDFNFKKLNSHHDDLAKLGLLNPLPEFLQKAGKMNYKGEFKGFHNDFVTYGSVTSDVGSLSTDINFKVKPDQPESYSGRLVGNQFNVGELFDIPEVGIASFDFKLKQGKGLNIQDIKTVFEGSVSQLNYMGYNYTNTSISGLFEKRKFDGKIELADPNAVLVFDGKIDFNNPIPQYQVKAAVGRANLQALGIDSNIQNIKGIASAQFSGKSLVDFTGKLNVSQVEIQRNETKIPLNKLDVKSEVFDTNRRIVLLSDFVDLKLEGVFDFREWNESYHVFLNHLFPDYYELPKKMPKDASYNVSMQFKNHPFLKSISGEKYDFGRGTLKGNYSSVNQSLRVDGKLSYMGYEDYEFRKWDFNIIKEPNQLLNLSMDIDKLLDKEKEMTHDIIFDAHILPNDIEFLFNFANPGDNFALASFGELKFMEDSIEAYFMESKMYVKNDEWIISEANKVMYEPNGIHIHNLNIYNDSSRLQINGEIVDKPDEELLVQLKNFDLNNLSQFVEGSSFGGLANGNVDLKRLSSEPYFASDLIIEDLTYNDDYLGQLKVISKAQDDPLVMDVYGELQSGLAKSLEVNGVVDLHENQRNMDLKVQLEDFEATPLNEIFVGLASQFDGKISAVLDAKGPFEKPKIEGQVKLNDVGMTVDYLQTRYVASGDFVLNEKSIDFDQLLLLDEQGDKGYLSGEIAHDYFDKFEFDLFFKDLDNFLVLNTTKEDNELFYGKAFVDGSMKVTGPLDDIYLDIFAKTRKGTEIFIPLVYEAGSSNVSYINFVDFKDTSSRIKQKQTIEGLTMNLTMEVTPDAKTELIFDEFVNDKITGRGEGKLRMQIASSGEFDMFGDYVIEEGEYPVSAFNTTPTKFILKKGGRILWDGDPYEAKIDLEANIVESVNPDMLLAVNEGDVSNTQGDKIEVECQLFLKGSLFNPDITFGLNVPGNGGAQTPTRFNSVLTQIMADPDELNRQVFAIIVFGSFIPPTFAESGAKAPSASEEIINTVRNSVSGMISNQLNHWISKYDKSLDISVDWDQGSTDENDQYIVEVKKSIFKEKIQLGAEYDFNSSNGSNPYEANIIYKFSDKVKFKGYHKLANDPTLGNANTVTTTGVGFFYRLQFNHFPWTKAGREEKEKRKAAKTANKSISKE